MAKAVLVMDMPESCNKCPLFSGNYTDMACRANGKGIDYPYPKNIRQDWCPLSLVPAKKQYDDIPDVSCAQWWSLGWNACIDTIVEKDEAG